METYPDDPSLASAVAEGMRERLFAAGAAGRSFAVALSGGRISTRVFAVLAAEPGGDWSAVARFFWADERCVPPDHPDSNYVAARRDLLEPLRIPADHVHRIAGELPPERAAELATAALRRETRAPDGTMPSLDLVLLGMGEDGHVASLFPGDDQTLADEQSVFLPVWNAPKPPPVRVTLSMGALLAAREVWVVIAGPGKEDALRESLSPAGRTPLARLLQRRPATRILCSRALFAFA